ncbi:hypothetical protein CEP53_007659 [Fusarium sp. AF-6]|nr:hypothetical protein CEP53_007659 [Fusarium sp. AF-6]
MSDEGQGRAWTSWAFDWSDALSTRASQHQKNRARPAAATKFVRGPEVEQVNETTTVPVCNQFLTSLIGPKPWPCFRLR